MRKKILLAVSSVVLVSCAQNTASIMSLEEKKMLFEATAKIIKNQEEIKRRLENLEKRTFENRIDIQKYKENFTRLQSFTKKSMSLNSQENKKISSILLKLNQDVNKNAAEIKKLKEYTVKLGKNPGNNNLKKLLLNKIKESYTTAKVNLRRKPDRFSRKLTSIDKNTKISVKGWVKGKDGNLWLNVKYLDLEGYILAKYVKNFDK